MNVLDVMKGEIRMLYGKYAEPVVRSAFHWRPNRSPTVPPSQPFIDRYTGKASEGMEVATQETNTSSELHRRLQDQSNTERFALFNATNTDHPNSNTYPTSAGFTAFADNLLIRSVTDLW